LSMETALDAPDQAPAAEEAAPEEA
jgi:hypothetical protein